MNIELMYAKYNQAGNQTIYHILSKLSNDDREKDRGSFYGSLSGMLLHIMGGTFYFLSMYKEALKNNDAAIKALVSIENLSLPEGNLSSAQWKETGTALDAIDAAYVKMAEAIGDSDLKNPVKIDWYGGNPAEVPLQFMLHQLVVHNTHHRGQISQILDSLKIDNDYSGINVAFM